MLPHQGRRTVGNAWVAVGTGETSLITVKTFRDPWDAHLFRMRLEADGIPAFVANDQHVWMKWPISTALGGVRVQVPNGCGEDAEDTLARCVSANARPNLPRCSAISTI